MLLVLVFSLPLAAAHADEAVWEKWDREERADTKARSPKFKAERVSVDGGAYLKIEAEARKAVKRLTPAKAAEFNVKLNFQVQLWGLDKGDGEIGRYLRGIKPVRLGDYNNNVEAFMKGVKQRAQQAGKHPDVSTYTVISASIVRPVIKSRASVLKTRFKSALRQRRIKKSSTKRAPAKASAPKQAKTRVRSRGK